MDHHDHTDHIHPVESPLEYAKFAGVIAAILLASVLLTSLTDWTLLGWMVNFMAVFFITFGAFKLVNLEMFVITYRSYDILAKQFPWWGWAFPFVELGLGVAYFLVGSQLWLNVLVIAVTGLASIGVLRELRRKSKFKCACLGTVIKLPLTKVSFVEDFAMMVMAAVMIFMS